MEKFGTAVILAGGRSSRMGFDKQFLKINEKRLIDELSEELKKEFDEIIIITNKPEEYKESNYIIREDIIKGMGPLSGIHSGLKSATSKYVYFIACDMPNINLDYIRHMKSEIKNLNLDSCVTKYKEHIETLNAFYSKDIINNIEKNLLEGNRSIRYLLEELDVYYIKECIAREFSPDWDMFLNLNTKEGLEKYLILKNKK